MKDEPENDGQPLWQLGGGTVEIVVSKVVLGAVTSVAAKILMLLKINSIATFY